MYSCTECGWEETDDKVNWMTVDTSDEILCPLCGTETEWYDGTEEETI